MYWAGSKIDGSSFHGRAFDLIKRQVLLGTLRPHEQLPPERKLSETLGISRVTLREALKLLEAEGILVAVRGAKGGTFVAGEDAINAIARKHILFRADLVWRSLEYLRANFVLAANFACERRNPTDIHKLRTAATSIGDARVAGELREAQYMFCAGVGAASMNPLFQNAVEAGLEGIFHPMVAAVPAVAARRVKLCHPIIEAIVARDRLSAVSAASAFLDDMAVQIAQIMTGAVLGETLRDETEAHPPRLPGQDIAKQLDFYVNPFTLPHD